jgi:predicted anti-sigma-YlaC factor YlaD
MNCRPYQRWIEDEASGKLSARAESRLREHLKKCGACRQYRERTVSLAHLLARTRAHVPVLDVRNRVMAAILAGERAVAKRAWSGRRVLWRATAASLVLLVLLGTVAGLSVMLFPSGPLRGGAATWRLLKGTGATLWSLLGAAGSLLAGLLDATARTVVALAPLLPFLEIAGVAILALTLCSAALPLARELLGGARALRSEGR